jgi:hypothetical protein
MSRLEDLQPNAAVRGILPDALVTVVSVQWFGSEALELTYKNAAGKVANELLYRHDEPRLQVVEHGRPWSFDGDGHLFRLVSEAHRIRLAHLFDPVLAVHTSLVEPLPHQITAVYEAMLPRQPLAATGSSKTTSSSLVSTNSRATRTYSRSSNSRIAVGILWFVVEKSRHQMTPAAAFRVPRGPV